MWTAILQCLNHSNSWIYGTKLTAFDLLCSRTERNSLSFPYIWVHFNNVCFPSRLKHWPVIVSLCIFSVIFRHECHAGLETPDSYWRPRRNSARNQFDLKPPSLWKDGNVRHTQKQIHEKLKNLKGSLRTTTVTVWQPHSTHIHHQHDFNFLELWGVEEKQTKQINFKAI